jgi:glycosyltransferase A (GT-A) superfamily protein (DUF2064 family)
VLAAVWGLERAFPKLDILWFIPKSWRTTEPLYQLSDNEALQEVAKDMKMTAADLSMSDLGKDADQDSFNMDLKDNKGAHKAAEDRRDRLDDSAHVDDSAHARSRG